ncbi:MAG: DNA polymerase III subunit gamma/tau [Clostridia bacterium]|nr:DNA polymerase III subunit gamma/tau [Clostridia bacterium]
MAYVALYRKFRPHNFRDMVGQEHITKTLKNQIKNSRVAHAYLFSGGRGSGKTTTAKILARAVNCLNPIDGEPCNECEICKQALEGSLIDISEIDAASNNGVDNIRDIREEVEFIPTSGKYRVYIIDEVHMLSTGAFNALLKTLEEPPKHVIFILATTEPQKLPVTILSRCQRFDFKRISIDDIIKRLKIICTESNIEIEDGALKIIAKMSDGAMRDAISILERCVADGSEKISEEQIRELVGIPEIDYLLGITKDILSGEAAKVLQDSENLINSGKDLDVFTWELIKFIRDLLMLQISDNLVVYKDEDKAKMQALVSNCTKERLLELITEISLLQNSMKWATDKEVIFETGLIRITMNGSLENKTANVKQNASQNVASNTSAAVAANASEKVLSEDDKNKEEVLTLLKENHKMIMHTILKNAEIKKVDEDLVHIIFSKTLDDVNKQYMQKDDSKIVIKEMVKKVFDKEMKIKYVF